MEKIYMYVQFDGMVYQQIVGSRLISLLLREGFYVKPPDIQTVLPHRQVQLYLSI